MVMRSTGSKKDISWVFGNDTDDVLGNMFDRKLGAHVETPGTMIPPPMYSELWEKLMQSGSDGRKRSAYINIPFCQTKCLYCGFFKNWSEPRKETEYVDLLIREMERDRDSSFMRSSPFNAIYIGGGTPSTLSVENIERLTNAINENLFMANDCEFTFESRLYQMDDEKIDACMDGGVNRFSFGVQSFDTKVRNAIGRVLDREHVMERLNHVKDIGRATVVIDLMYGLSYQTDEVWKNDLRTFTDLELDGCDLYQLIVFKDSDLEKKVDDRSIERTATVPEQSRMFSYGVDFMEENGFRRLSNCHWARGTRERSMYNSMTLSNSIVVPFGSGSGGNIGNHRFFLDPRLENYKEMVKEGRKPLMGMVENSKFQSMYRDITGSLNEGGINLRSLGMRYGMEELGRLIDLLNAWQEKGLLGMKKHKVELTIAGQFWSVNLSQALVDWHQNKISDNDKKSGSMSMSGHPPGIPKGHPEDIPKGHPPRIPKGHPPGIDIIGVKKDWLKGSGDNEVQE
jgi:oxygen-independent coproporphyrinogen-3 oxidase